MSKAKLESLYSHFKVHISEKEQLCLGFTDGKEERMTIHNVPSFAHRLDANLEVEGIGTLTVDTAYGGDSFVIVDAETLGFSISPDELGPQR